MVSQFELAFGGPAHLHFLGCTASPHQYLLVREIIAATSWFGGPSN